MGLVTRFLQDRHGGTAIEYALIAGTISIGIAAVYFAISDEVEAMYQFIIDQVLSV
ncbi:MAG: Flp family type IVb pilin [Pseudomonadota bacterium]